MKDAGEDKAADEQQKESKTTLPEFEAKGQEEEELTKKTSEDSADKQLDDQPKDQDQDEKFYDAEMPSPPQQRSPTLKRPPIPHCSPPKDPTPPHSVSDNESSSSSSHHSPPPSPKAKFGHKSDLKKASIAATKAFLRAKHATCTA